jgi:hypothetical protein
VNTPPPDAPSAKPVLRSTPPLTVSLDFDFSIVMMTPQLIRINALDGVFGGSVTVNVPFAACVLSLPKSNVATDAFARVKL